MFKSDVEAPMLSPAARCRGLPSKKSKKSGSSSPSKPSNKSRKPSSALSTADKKKSPHDPFFPGSTGNISRGIDSNDKDLPDIPYKFSKLHASFLSGWGGNLSDATPEHLVMYHQYIDLSLQQLLLLFQNMRTLVHLPQFNGEIEVSGNVVSKDDERNA
ncbi:hypothetical protein HJC23_001716 [Cyclotella cryptica]|uniref:Uncharacterized protein n=1 Tax=Cyclotella cryptica TaxID=29204 RepID=A0ABD3NS74_9STRA